MQLVVTARDMQSINTDVNNLFATLPYIDVTKISSLLSYNSSMLCPRVLVFATNIESFPVVYEVLIQVVSKLRFRRYLYNALFYARG